MISSKGSSLVGFLSFWGQQESFFRNCGQELDFKKISGRYFFVIHVAAAD